MTRIIAFVVLLASSNLAAAQDLVITNGRILDGTGTILEQGSIVVRDGRIVSVSASAPEAQGAAEIEAQGMTVMPGMIDTHRHLSPQQTLYGDRLEAAVIPVLEGLLEKGLTTIMSPGDPGPAILSLRRQLAEDSLKGPRLLAVGPLFTAPDDWPVRLCQGDADCRAVKMVEVTDPAEAQARVREVAAAGVDAIKAIYDRLIVPEVQLDDSVLAAIMQEATRLGLPGMVHAATAEDMIRVVELGARRLVHTPHTGVIADGPGAGVLREAGVSISTTVSFSSPQFAEASGREYLQAAEHELLLQNIRHLWDEGVNVAFGTDSPPALGPTEFMVEVHELSKVLSPSEVITALTRNAATYLGLSDDVGTLEQGKVADIIIIDGDPLADVGDLANVEVVIQGGRIVVDNR